MNTNSLSVIFQFLDVKAIAAVRGTNKRWKELLPANNEKFRTIVIHARLRYPIIQFFSNPIKIERTNEMVAGARLPTTTSFEALIKLSNNSSFTEFNLQNLAAAQPAMTQRKKHIAEMYVKLCDLLKKITARQFSELIEDINQCKKDGWLEIIAWHSKPWD